MAKECVTPFERQGPVEWMVRADEGHGYAKFKITVSSSGHNRMESLLKHHRALGRAANSLRARRRTAPSAAATAAVVAEDVA